MKNLLTDCIDLIQLHSCDTHILNKGDVIRALQDSKIEGKTRFIGYSGDNEGADWAVKSNLFDTLQTSYSIADQRARTKNVLSEARKRNLGIIAKRPIGNAALLGVKHHINSTSYEFFKANAYDEYFKRLLDITNNNNIDINEIDPIELSMAFSLNRKDIFSSEDLGLIKAIGKNYYNGKIPDKKKAEELALKWSPWRTVACWFLWRSIDPNVVVY